MYYPLVFVNEPKYGLQHKAAITVRKLLFIAALCSFPSCGHMRPVLAKGIHTAYSIDP